MARKQSNKPPRDEDLEKLKRQNLKVMAATTDQEIITRSIITGILVMGLLFLFDVLLEREVNLAGTLMVGFIVTGLFALYDLILRWIARNFRE